MAKESESESESQHEQMKKENRHLRQNRDEILKNYVEVVNENLELHRQIEILQKRLEIE